MLGIGGDTRTLNVERPKAGDVGVIPSTTASTSSTTSSTSSLGALAGGASPSSGRAGP